MLYICSSRSKSIRQKFFFHRDFRQKWGSGGLPPLKIFDFVPSRTSENALFTEQNLAAFISDFHTKKEKLIALPGFIEF